MNLIKDPIQILILISNNIYVVHILCSMHNSHSLAGFRRMSTSSPSSSSDVRFFFKFDVLGRPHPGPRPGGPRPRILEN